MSRDRFPCQPQVFVRLALPERGSLLERQLGRDVSRERVVRRRLICDQVEWLSTSCQLGKDDGGVSKQSDRERPSFGRRRAHPSQRVFQRVCGLVQIPGLEPSLDAGRIDLDAQDRGPTHRRCEWLSAPHPTETSRQDRPARQIRGSEVLLTGRGERLVRALQDPLRPDVDPRPRRHLSVHRQAKRFEAAELLPRRPPRHDQ